MEVILPTTSGSSASNRPNRTEAIKKFLELNAPPDLASLYSHDMECQVLVARDNGQVIKGEYRGKEYQAFSDGKTRWKSFRIPYKAGSAPEYEDKPISYDLSEHAEAIGMTGWNWKERKSIYLAYDFDSIIGHNVGLSDVDLAIIVKKATAIPWVTVRRSTSGKGLHLYVFLEPVTTENHHEHAALARAVLSKMSSLTGYDFQSKVDICGGNMWLWHRKYEESKKTDLEGFKLIKEGIKLVDIPHDWRAHIRVAKKQATRSDLQLPGVEQGDLNDILNERSIVPLDEDHVNLIKALEGTDSWWDADHHILITHTWSLKTAHEKLGLKGIYNTVSTGSAQGQDRNCFCMPRDKGAWLVRRYQQVAECPPWFIDKYGFSCCHLNREPDLKTLVMSYGGIETEKRGFLFRSTDEPQQIMGHLGASMGLVNQVDREVTLREEKDGRIIVKIKRETMDPPTKFPGYEPNKDGTWTRVFRGINRNNEDIDNNQYDNLCRHLITSAGSEAGWVIFTDRKFVAEPLTHVRLALAAKGFTASEITDITGGAVLSPWRLVSIPFDPEYPGDRQWNRDAPQLMFELNVDRDALYYPSWMKVLQHCGSGLDSAVLADGWCAENGIYSGADYLKCWLASVFQEPTQPLPYLAFIGPQNCGKSIFHEAISMLFKPGYMKADNALTNQQNFNGELQNAIICVVEETDLRGNRNAYNKIKDWVTSPTLAVRPLYQETFLITNTTHWIQCANDANFIPMLPGDTRIVAIDVPELTEIIPKKALLDMLRSEASDFLTELMRMSIPPSPDRLNIPPIRTEAKDRIEEGNQNDFHRFIAETCYYVPGSYVTVASMYASFISTMQPSQAARWSKARMGREVPSPYIKGRHSSGDHIIANISFSPDPDPNNKNRPVWKRRIGTDVLILA